jgi:hypothetical protein
MFIFRSKEFHQTGNKVQLPAELAEFVGSPHGFVLRGKAARQAFQTESVVDSGHRRALSGSQPKRDQLL